MTSAARLSADPHIHLEPETSEPGFSGRSLRPLDRERLPAEPELKRPRVKGGSAEKAEKRRRKQGDAEHKPLKMRERVRNQWDVFDLQRRMLDTVEHSVRYALVIFGAVNTGVVILMTRESLLAGLSPSMASVLRVVSTLYGLAAFVALTDAVRSLRPRLLPRDIRRMGFDPITFRPGDGVILPVIPTGGAATRLSALHQNWQKVSAEALSEELSTASRACAALVEVKAHALWRLYRMLAVMLVLVALGLAVLGLARAGL